MTGQFANLLRGAGVRIDEQWNKYDGRRYYREEMEGKIIQLINKGNIFTSFFKRIFTSSRKKTFATPRK